MVTTIDPSSLTDEQLQALMVIDPDAARAEFAKRQAYPCIEDALSDLRTAHVKFQAVLEGFRTTPVVQAIKETNLGPVLEKFFHTVRVRTDYVFAEPASLPVVKPKRRKKTEDAQETQSDMGSSV